MYEKKILTKLCFLKESLVSVSCCDPTSLCLQILRMGTNEGGKWLEVKEVERVLSGFRFLYSYLEYFQTKDPFYLFISENQYFRVCAKVQSLEHTLKPKGWTIEMPCSVIRIETMLENYSSSPRELLWRIKCYYCWLSLIFLKIRVPCILHKLGLNVMIVQKKFNGIKIFWQWKKSVSNVVISREIIYVFQNAFNYIKQIKLVIECIKEVGTKCFIRWMKCSNLIK